MVDQVAERVPTAKKTEATEAAISKSPSDPSPFLKELDKITGPQATGGRITPDIALAQLDKDHYGTRAQGLEAQRIFTEVNKSNWFNHDLTKEQIVKYGADQTKSPAERALAARVAANFTDISSDGKGISKDDIAKYLAREQNKEDVRNLHAKRPDGKSLLDDVGDGKGGVSGDKLTKKLQDTGLQAQDRASLEKLNAARGYSGDMTADQIKKLDQNAGLRPEEISRATKRPEPTSAEQQATRDALTQLTAKPATTGQSLLDRLSDGKGGVDQTKMDDFMAHPERHNLSGKDQSALSYLNKNSDSLDKDGLKKTAADAGSDFDSMVKNPTKINPTPEQASQADQVRHLFDKGLKNSPSLYDRLKNPDGSVDASSIDKLGKTLHDPKDLASLEVLRRMQDENLLGQKKNLTKDDIASLAKDHNLRPEAIRAAGLDRPVQQPTVEAVRSTVPELNDPKNREKIAEALKVHKGEGYYHVAEQLLTTVYGHKFEPSTSQLKELVAQLKKENTDKYLSSSKPLTIDPAYLAKLYADAAREKAHH